MSREEHRAQGVRERPPGDGPAPRDDTVPAAPYSVFAGVYDDVMADIEYDEWAEFILREAGARGFAGGRILDLACGTGNAATPLIRRGYEVTGVDASADMLAVARGKHPGADWIPGDFESFAAPGRYALVQSVFDAVNNLLDPAAFGRMARRVLAHLQPGGIFAFDANTSHGLRDLWDAGGVSGWAGATFYAWDYSYDEASGVARVEAGFVTDGRRSVEMHSERKYDQEELRALLAAAGFATVDILDYPEGAPAEEDSPRVWVFASAPRKRLNIARF